MQAGANRRELRRHSLREVLFCNQMVTTIDLDQPQLNQ
jgi:hypothetical protein